MSIQTAAERSEEIPSREIDPALIILHENDIDDPTVTLGLENLTSYKIDHLKSWLIYRGDTLKGVDTLKDAQVKVLQYFNLGTNTILCDPTPEKKWLAKKARWMGLTLKLPTCKAFPPPPEHLVGELSNLKSKEGWSKSLDGLPGFSVERIESYALMVSAAVLSKSTKVKKHFSRGEQLLEERYLDLSSIHAKQTSDLFCAKGVCAASMKKQDRWVFIAINKPDASVKYAFCQCPAGKAGTCSHAFALMKLFAKWVIDKIKNVPEIEACTSRACIWSVPQSRNRLDKPPISDLKISSPIKKKRPSGNEHVISSSVRSSLYDARRESNKENNTNEIKIKELQQHLLKNNVKLPMLTVLNPLEQRTTETTLGAVPIGSLLSYQCPLVPPSFNIYSNLPDAIENSQLLQFNDHPPYPFNDTDNAIEHYVAQISCSKKKQVLQSLHLSKENVVEIEIDTRDQALSTKWHSCRKNRFTASLCNKLGPKTPRGLKTLAYNIINGNKQMKQNKIISYKLSYGKYYEPIAIKHYENFMRISGYKTVVESSGLVLDCNNFVIGASPDGKVICNNDYGILEVKCSEEYSNIDPKDVCFIAKNPCIVYNTDSGKISINKDHSYYNQIQMQLGLTSQSWCDFVFYTTKGLVIDRVMYDEIHWKSLRNKVLEFYFNYMLDEIIADKSVVS